MRCQSAQLPNQFFSPRFICCEPFLDPGIYDPMCGIYWSLRCGLVIERMARECASFAQRGPSRLADIATQTSCSGARFRTSRSEPALPLSWSNTPDYRPFGIGAFSCSRHRGQFRPCSINLHCCVDDDRHCIAVAIWP